MKKFLLGLFLLAGLGSLCKAEVVTLSNASGGGTSNTNDLYIRFVTNASQNNLQTLTITGLGSASNKAVVLNNGSSDIFSGNLNIDSDVITFASPFTDNFGAGTYWLRVSGIGTSSDGSSATLGVSPSNPYISDSTLTTGFNSTLASGAGIRQVSLVISAVPEPSTFVLSGLAIGVGALLNRFRRKPNKAFPE